MVEKILTIFAGEDEDIIGKEVCCLAESGIDEGYYFTKEEFEYEYPESEPVKYEVTITVKKIY